MLDAIARGKSLVSGVIRIGGGVIGRVYAADMVWLAAQQREGRISQVAEPIIKKIEETQVRYIIIGAPIASMGMHALLTPLADLTEMKPIIAMKSAMGVYDFSIPFLLSGSMLLRCRSKLSGDTSIVLQLLWHLVKEGTYAMGGEVYKSVEILAKDVAKYLGTLEELHEAIEKEKRDLDSAIDVIRGKNCSETLTDTLDNAAAFAEHLRGWNQRLVGLEGSLHDYVTLANARKDSFDEAPYAALERAVEYLESVNAEEREQVALLYQTFYGITDCFAEIEAQMEEIRTLRNEIDQLFLKGEHLVESVLFVAQMNDMEVGALTNWHQRVGDMRIGFGGSATTLAWDSVMSPPRRTSPAQSSKMGRVAYIADDSSSFTELKRKELERKDPETCRLLLSSVRGLHTRRDAALQEIDRVHAPSSSAVIQKPFFKRDKEMVNEIERDLARVKESFASHKLSQAARTQLRKDESFSMELAEGIVQATPGATLARGFMNWWSKG